MTRLLEGGRARPRRRPGHSHESLAWHCRAGPLAGLNLELSSMMFLATEPRPKPPAEPESCRLSSEAGLFNELALTEPACHLLLQLLVAQSGLAIATTGLL